MPGARVLRLSLEKTAVYTKGRAQRSAEGEATRVYSLHGAFLLRAPLSRPPTAGLGLATPVPPPGAATPEAAAAGVAGVAWVADFTFIPKCIV